MQIMQIRQIPEEERPRERCRRLGAGALSAIELLSLVLGGGSSQGGGLSLSHRLLERFTNLQSLARADASEITTLSGMGPARSTALVAAFELGRRAARPRGDTWRTVSGPEDVVQILRPALDGLDQEAVAVLHLGARHQLLRVQVVALGSLNAAAVHPREVFRGAIADGAAAVVLGHNHPSGSPEPSADDVRLTKRLAACGETLGVALLDHIVLGDGSFVSLREQDLF